MEADEILRRYRKAIEDRGDAWERLEDAEKEVKCLRHRIGSLDSQLSCWRTLFKELHGQEIPEPMTTRATIKESA